MKSLRSDVLGFLGLASRAGAVVKGIEGTRRALRAREAKLVILAQDGSETQRTKVDPLAAASGVPQRVFGTRADLGAALGGAPVTAIAVTGRRFAEELLERIGSAEGACGRKAQRR